MTFFNVNIVVGDVLVVTSWIVWLWRDRRAMPPWRRFVLVLGLISTTSNLALFWALVTYCARTKANFVPLRDRCEPVLNAIVIVTLACAIAGKGRSRATVAISALSGWLLWVVPAIL